MKTSQAIPLLTLTAIAISLSACGGTWKAGASASSEGGVEIHGDVSGTWPRSIRPMNAFMAVLSPTDLYIETAGTDFILAKSGAAVVTLKDGAGTILAAQSFSWSLWERSWSSET